MCSCPVRAGKALEGHGRPLRITLSRASDCTKYEIMLDVALHFDPGGHSCAEKLNKTNDRVGRETRQLFKLGHGRRPGSGRDNRSDAAVHEGRRQTGRQQAHAGSRLKPLMSGKAPPDRPAFQPYWGKPAVRNERGDRGNVGIIRSPVRASILPDCGGRSAMSVPTAILLRLCLSIQLRLCVLTELL